MENCIIQRGPRTNPEELKPMSNRQRKVTTGKREEGATKGAIETRVGTVQLRQQRVSGQEAFRKGRIYG